MTDMLNHRTETEADERMSALNRISASVPGGYHCCSDEEGYPFLFVSKSFEQIVGYTKAQIEQELDNRFINLILPEDLPRFAGLENQLDIGGNGNVAYRIRRRDGEIRWVQDSTMAVEWNGSTCYQCTIADITDFVRQQEDFARRQAEFDLIAQNIPCGYHRCSTDDGFRLEFVSDSFSETVGYSREELLGRPALELVAPEDRAFFMQHEPILARDGRVDLVYRICRSDGTRRWIKDSTMKIRLGDKDTYQCILADITDHVEKLNEAREQAEAANRAKSAFLFNASHDIRTPMNAIQGFARIIQQNVDDPAVVEEAIRKIRQSGDTLMLLINDVLELSRIERGKAQVEPEVLDMEGHVRKLYEMFASEMEQADIRFRMENSIQHPMVLGDDLKLTRVAMNLLSNAKKFTPVGGSVTFGIREHDFDGKKAGYCLFVRDTGIGMSQEFQARAFEQFERERTSTDSGQPGSGLGLAIIKQLVDLMGGTCTIRSGLGEGTEVTVDVPLQLVDVAEREKAMASGQVCDLSGRHILLVEDNAFNREIARYVLEDLGCRVTETQNGAECLEKLLLHDPHTFDLILMDIQMPVMDGYTTTRHIRSMFDRQLSSIPVVAMTANAFDEDKKQCLEAGMNDHISKPVDPERLKQVLGSVLWRRPAEGRHS